MRKILFFPGAFNPPHLGHVEILKDTLKGKHFDEVWIVPSGKRDDKIISTHYKHRRNLGNLFVEFLQKTISTPITLVTDELDDATGKYTHEILEKIKSRPGIQTVQLIGSDGMTKLQEALSGRLKNEDFIVVKRDEKEISSTQIRNMIKNNDKAYQRMVSPKVADYIHLHRLYQTE